MRKTQGGFKLPPGVSFRKEFLSGNWAYVFRHNELGELGRVVIQGRPDGRTYLTYEVVGDANDPMTEKRAAIFKPLSMSLARQFDIATGGTESVPLLPGPPAPLKRAASQLIQCEKCRANVALLIFADDATDRGGLEDYARLMYPKVVELNLPTWVIGPPINGKPSFDSPSEILKIWPKREAVCQLSPEEFDPIIKALVTTHCRI
ncbi:hypothetical protein FJY90_01740 [Candidatus Gottesmanbacteria bacterium]|nr:hypothetical protein [Candidatus Gottesmanbacteria bacterium]